MVFSVIPTPVAKAASAPYFSMVLIAPTSNPARRQWAQIIQNSFTAAGIDARLVYMSFSQWLSLLLGNSTCPAGQDFIAGASNCPLPSFANGGWDAGFVGNGGGTVLPDFSTQNVVFYKAEIGNDLPPIGQNYYWWKNSTFNQLADQYGQTFDQHTRLSIARQMVRIVADARPGIVIDYPSSVYAFNPNTKPWGTTNAVTQNSAGLDWQHWQTGSITTMNVAVTGDLDAVNPLPNAAQNSLYDRYLYGPVSLGGNNLGAGSLEEVDARGVGVYINALANRVVPSPDHLTYTVSFKPHTFHDGVQVTADDYVFGNMAGVLTSVGYVASGTAAAQLGSQLEFHFLNGTADYSNNGVYQHGGSAPAGWHASSIWTSINSTAFSFTLPHLYLFADPIVTGSGALPMHLYEQVPFTQWTSTPLSGFTSGCTDGALWKTCSAGGISNHNFKVTWNAARYGGNGSYIAYGPVGDGAYVYHGYDATTQTATLVKFTNYWNATGLAALHEFTINTVHVTHIAGKDAAIAGYGTGPGSINYLDSQYSFNKDDARTMAGLGATVAYSEDPSNGWQEMPLNDANPTWGLGTATPAGQKDPSHASTYAKDVRTAMSFLVPREEIVNNLLQGLAVPGITEFFPTQGIITPGDIYQGITFDPFDQTKALSYLAAAGYSTGVLPPQQGGGLVQIPPINVSSIAINVPTFLLGNSITLSGTFAVDPSISTRVGTFYVTLQQSLDSGKTWAPVTLGTATPGGYYNFAYAPTSTGNVSYRAFFTGVPATYVNGTGGPLRGLAVPGPSLVESYAPPQATTPCHGLAGRSRPCAANSTDIQYSQVTALKVGTVSDLFSQLATGLNNAFNSLASKTTAAINAVNSNAATEISQLQSNVPSKTDFNTLSTQVSNLNSQVSTLTTVSYAALAVAVILGLLAIALSRRKPS